MATELATAYISLVPTLKGAGKSIQNELDGVNVDQSGKKMGKQLGDGLTDGAKTGGKGITSALGGIVKVAGPILAAVGFSNLVTEAARATDATQKFKSTLEFAGKADEVERLTASTRKYADETVYDLSDIQNITAQLAANSVKDYDKLAEAAGNLNAVAGGNAETFSSVGMVLTQTAGAGKLTTENWNQLADAIPGASGKLQEAMLKNGAYTGNFREAMEKGEISAEEFNQAILDLGFDEAAVEAAKSTSTFEGAMGNLQAAAVGGIGDVLIKIKPAITGAINSLVPIVEGAFSTIVTGAGFVADNIGLIAPAVAAVTAAFAAFKAANFASTLMAQFGSLSNVMSIVKTSASGLFATLAANPIALVVAAIAALCAGLVVAFNTNEQFRSTVLAAWDGIKAAAAEVWPAIQQAVTSACEAMGNVVNAVWPVIQGVITTVMNVVKAVIGTVLAAIKGDWEGAWNGIKSVGQTVWEAIKSIVTAGINAAKSVISSVLDAIKATWGSIWGGIKDKASQIWDAIKSLIGSAIDAAAAKLKSVLSAIKSAWDAVWTAIKDFANATWDAICGLVATAIGSARDTICSVMDAVKAAWDAVWTAIKATASSIWDAIKALVTNAVNSTRDTIKSVMDAVKSAWDSTWSAIRDFAKSVWDAVKAVVSAATEAMSATITNVMNAVKAVWTSAWNAIKGLAQTVWNGIKSLVSSAINAVKVTMSSVLGAISGAWSNTWNGIKGFFSNIWNGIRGGASSGVDAVFRTVTGFKDRVLGFFSGAGSWLVNSGRSMLDGLSRGIQNGINGAVNAVKRGLNRIRSFFPFSPAKEGPFSGHGWVLYSGMSIAESLGEGFSKAIPGAIGQVDRGMSAMSAALTADAGAGYAVATSSASPCGNTYNLYLDGSALHVTDTVANAMDRFVEVVVSSIA